MYPAERQRLRPEQISELSGQTYRHRSHGGKRYCHYTKASWHYKDFDRKDYRKYICSCPHTFSQLDDGERFVCQVGNKKVYFSQYEPNEFYASEADYSVCVTFVTEDGESDIVAFRDWKSFEACRTDQGILVAVEEDTSINYYTPSVKIVFYHITIDGDSLDVRRLTTEDYSEDNDEQCLKLPGNYILDKYFTVFERQDDGPTYIVDDLNLCYADMLNHIFYYEDKGKIMVFDSVTGVYEPL